MDAGQRLLRCNIIILNFDVNNYETFIALMRTTGNKKKQLEAKGMKTADS
jgi:hypothetical protein